MVHSVAIDPDMTAGIIDTLDFNIETTSQIFNIGTTTQLGCPPETASAASSRLHSSWHNARTFRCNVYQNLQCRNNQVMK